MFGDVPVLPQMTTQEMSDGDIAPTELEGGGSTSEEEDGPIDQGRRISLASIWSSASTCCPVDDAESSLHEAWGGAESSIEQQGRFSLAGLFDDAPVFAPAASAPPPPAELSIQDVFPSPRAEVASWHPNRVLMTVGQLLYSRMAQQYRNRRCRVKRSQNPYQELRSWIRTGIVATQDSVDCAARKHGRDVYRRVVAAICGMTARQVSKMSSAMWRTTNRDQVDAWARMAALFDQAEVKPFLHGLVSGEEKTNKCRQKRQQAVKDADANYVVHGYGFSLCYNTTLGQNDTQVIKLLQTKIKGEALRKAMSEMPLYRDALARAWDHFEPLGRSLGLPLVAVGLEHSEHATHPGRAHFHVTMNIDIQGGLNGRTVREVAVSKSVFEWQGMPPHIRALQVRRTTSSAISSAVLQAYYYVAGPKTSSILKRCSRELFEEKLWVRCMICFFIG